jgi:Intracellular proteinase inhibitor
MKLTTLTLISLFITAGASANSYITLNPTDNIAYGNAAGRRIVTTVSATSSPGWKKYSDFMNNGDKFIWTNPGNESVFLFNGNTSRAEKMVNFADPVGTKYSFSLGACTTGATLAQKGLRMTTAAGVAQNVVRLTFSAKCFDGGVGEAWFAPQVGLVKWVEQSIVGPVTFEMTDGKIASRTFGVVPATALKSSASFPVTEVAVNAGVVNGGATLNLTNTSNVDMVLHFTSGQEFEISLIDANNQVVNTWSKNIRFIQGGHDVVIAAGKTKSFGGTLELLTFDGKPLAVGDYTLRIEMKHSNVLIGLTSTTSVVRAETMVMAVRGN